MRAFSLMFLALLTAGCMQIDYTGRKFPASGNSVKVFNTAAELPQDTYTIVGRFTVVTRTDVHVYDVEEEVCQRAAAYGADALCLAATEVKEHGTYNTDAEEFGTPAPAASPRVPAETQKFGKPVKLTSGQFTGKRNVYKFLVLKKSADVKSALSL